jgi:putative spermidine/putrescine transport system permease protein
MRALGTFLRRHRRLSLASVLGAPVFWMLVVYIGSLGLMVVSAFFRVDEFTQKSTSELTTQNVRDALASDALWKVTRNSLGVAVAVTIVCFCIALPAAFYVSKIAKPWARRGLIVAMLMPLWAGYLVKGYAWKAMLRPAAAEGASSGGGFLASVFGWTPGFGWIAVVLALSYLWLPYMILPIYAGLDRLPASLLDASGDLGARPFRTFRSVILPLLVPSIAAGSIFTFSLSLGDFITPNIVTEGKVQMVGNIISRTLLAPNQPLAAAYTLFPLVIVVVYLASMRRLGAFENL